jgi:benzoate-CoA ligase family protein
VLSSVGILWSTRSPMSAAATPPALPTFSPDMHMAEYYLLARLREGKGEQAAILWGNSSYTYQQVADRSMQVAHALLQRGVRRGERVLLILPDSPAYAWALFGALMMGAVVAMGNPDSPASQHDYLLDYTRATCIITVPRVAEAMQRAPLLGAALVADAATGSAIDAPVSCSGASFSLAEATAKQPMTAPVVSPPLHRDETAMWLFTSGSTGEPKANVHTHRDFLFNTEVYAKQTVGFTEADVTLSISRLYFGYATGTNLLFPFALGGKTALFSEKPTPELLAEKVAFYKPTIVTNVPTMLGKLLEYDRERRERGEPALDFSSVRFCLSAGEALPEPLLRRWLERFQSDVYDGIGSAEMFHIYASNRPGDIKPGSLGKVVCGYQLRVLPEDAEGPGAPPCAPGEIGVLWVRGDSVSQGYWLDRDKSFATFFGHWCRTGDLFSVDAEGYLYFSGRSDDLLKVGGIFVAPGEIEDALLGHPDVVACAVVGVLVHGLQKSKAFVTLRAACEANAALEEALRSHLRERIAKYKVPQVFSFVPDLPKNDRGKIDRKKLRELSAGETA